MARYVGAVVMRAALALAAVLLAGAAALRAVGGRPRPQASGPRPAVAQGKPGSGSALPRLTPAVVWNPEAKTVQAIRTECGKGETAQVTACFIDGMQSHGASPEAVAFARFLSDRTHGALGYAIDFTEGGRVAVVHAAFPQRQNSPEVWMLVNGSPALIDVDDRSLLPLAKVKDDLIYQEIRRSFPKAELYAGDRSQPSPPLSPKPNGGQEFPVNYDLRDGCPTCKVAGHVQVAFEFVAGAKFSGAHLVGVWMTPDKGQLAPVTAGTDFTIHLLANHSAGDSWSLVGTVNPQFVKHIGTDYRIPGGDPSKGGVEDWRFHSVSRGRSILRFQEVRTGAKGKTPVKNFYFVVTGE